MPTSSVLFAAFIVVLAVPSASEETAGFQVSIDDYMSIAPLQGKAFWII
jgi:hypothetical protein